MANRRATRSRKLAGLMRGLRSELWPLPLYLIRDRAKMKKWRNGRLNTFLSLRG